MNLNKIKQYTQSNYNTEAYNKKNSNNVETGSMLFLKRLNVDEFGKSNELKSDDQNFRRKRSQSIYIKSTETIKQYLNKVSIDKFEITNETFNNLLTKEYHDKIIIKIPFNNKTYNERKEIHNYLLGCGYIARWY